MSLRDQEFFLSNDLVGLLSVSGGRRRCEICQNCRRCSLSLAFTSFEQEEETTECRKNIRLDDQENRFVVNFCFYPKEKMKGIAIEDFNSHLGLARKRFLDLEAKTLKKFSPEVISATNDDVEARFSDGQFCTLEQMRALDEHFDDYKWIFHPLCLALQPAKGLHMVRVCQDPSTPNKAGFSFNDFLLEGKSIHCQLMELMLRIRRSRFLAQSDVSRYYNRVWLEHWCAAMTGFIWRRLGSKEEPKICFSRVLNFGIKNASLLAAICLEMAIRRSCEDKGLTDFEQFRPYVDDLFILESQDVSLLYQRMENVKISLEKCSFPVKKFQLPFSSVFVNNPNFCHMLEAGVEVESSVKELYDIYKDTGKLISPQEYMSREALLLPELPPRLYQEEEGCEEMRAMYSDQFIPDRTVCTHKILGSHARLHSDSISSVVRMNISSSSRGAKTGPDLTFSNYEEILDSPQFMKRGSLSLLMSFWDPPGTFQPMVTNFKFAHKLLLLLRPNLRWNEPIPQEMRPLYKYLVKESLFLNPFPVKRFLTPDQPELYDKLPILLVFCDASEKIATAVHVYLSWERLDKTGCYNSLLTAKSYIHSIKNIKSAAVMESTALATAAEIYSNLARVHDLQVSEVRFISDSRVSLLSLKRPLTSHSKAVAHRWDKFLSVVQICECYWCPSLVNPSDVSSRIGAGHHTLRSKFFLEAGSYTLPRSSWLCYPVTDNRINKNISIAHIPPSLRRPPDDQQMLSLFKQVEDLLCHTENTGLTNTGEPPDRQEDITDINVLQCSPISPVVVQERSASSQAITSQLKRDGGDRTTDQPGQEPTPESHQGESADQTHSPCRTGKTGSGTLGNMAHSCKTRVHLQRKYLDVNNVEPWAPMILSHGLEKTVRILTCVVLFFQVLKQRKGISEVSLKTSEYQNQVRTRLEVDASKMSPEFIQKSALRNSTVQDLQGRWYLVSRYINRPRLPLFRYHQLILHQDSALCKGALFDEHNRNHGRSPLDILCKYEVKYYTKNARKLLRTLEYNCGPCKKIKIWKQTNHVPLGPVPADRLAQDPPFSVCSADVLGPIYLQEEPTDKKKLKHLSKKPGKNVPRAVAPVTKCWVYSITCHATSAVQLYHLKDLSSSSVIACLQSHLARRGRMTRLVSDMAEAFLHCYKVMGTNLSTLEKGRVEQEQTSVHIWAGSCGIETITIAPHAPWVVGDCEEKNKWIKLRFSEVLTGRQLKQCPPHFQFTLDAVSEYCNSRPLNTYQVEPLGRLLSRQDFLTGCRGRIGSFPLYHPSPLLRAFYQMDQERMVLFQALHSFYHRRLLRTYRFQQQEGPVFQVGDICYDISIRRTSYRHYGLLQIMALDDSKDKEHRWATCRYRFYYSTVDKIIRRPTTRLLLMLSVEQAKKGMSIPEYFDEGGKVIETNDNPDGLGPAQDHLGDRKGGAPNMVDSPNDNLVDELFQDDDLESMVPPVVQPHNLTDPVNRDIPEKEDVNDDITKEDLPPATYVDMEDNFDKDEAEDDLRNLKSRIPDWDQLREKYQTDNLGPAAAGPDIYDQELTPPAAAAPGLQGGEEQPEALTQAAPPPLDTRRSKRNKRPVNYHGLSNNIFFYQNGLWQSFTHEYPKVAQTSAFVAQPIRLGSAAPPLATTPGPVQPTRLVSASTPTATTMTPTQPPTAKEVEEVVKVIRRWPVRDIKVCHAMTQTEGSDDLLSLWTEDDSAEAMTTYYEIHCLSQDQGRPKRRRRRQRRRKERGDSDKIPELSNQCNHRAGFLLNIFANVLPKLMLFLLAMSYLLPVTDGLPQCRGALRVDLASLRRTQTDLSTAVTQARDIQQNYTSKPSTYRMSSYKIVEIINDQTMKEGTFVDADVYTKMQGICMGKGFLPLTFTYGERTTLYQLMKKFGLPKIVLNLVIGDLTGRGMAYFAGTGQMTHLSGILANDLKTDVQKKNLQFVLYSVDAAGGETVEIIDPPYTLVKFGSGTQHYVPMLCEPSDLLSNQLLGLKADIAEFVSNHDALLTNYTTEMDKLVNETLAYVETEVPGNLACPNIDLFQSSYVPLFPFKGKESWPTTAPDIDQEQFIKKWNELQNQILKTPKYIDRARKLLQYSDFVPARNDPGYVFSGDFYKRLAQGEAFEIMITICSTIVLTVFCCVTYCLKRYCCPDVPMTVCCHYLKKLIPSRNTLANVFQRALPADQAGGNIGQETDRQEQFPLQAYAQNYSVFPPRSTNRGPGRFQIILQPAGARNTRPVQDIIEL